MRPRDAAWELLSLAVLAGLTALATRPLAWDASRGFPQYDTQFTQLQLTHLQQALLGRTDWWHGPLGWPLPYGTAQADFVLGQAVLAFPLAALDPARAAAWLGLLGLGLTAWLGHLLAQALLGRGPHTWLAGLWIGLAPAAVAHTHHINLVHHALPLAALLLAGMGIQGRRPLLLGLGTACVGLSAHWGIYMGVHAAWLVGMLVLGAAVAGMLHRRGLLALVAGGTLAALAGLPVLQLYARASAALEARLEPGELVAKSWDLGRLWAWESTAWLPAQLAPAEAFSRAPGALPGVLAGLLGLVGAVHTLRRPGPTRWLWGVCLAVGLSTAALALGPTPQLGGEALGIPGPEALLRQLPGYASLRAPDRWLFLTQAAVGLFATAGLLRLVRGRPLAVQAAAVGLTLLVALGELPTPRAQPLAQPLPRVYLLLDELGMDGAITELREPGAATCRCHGGLRMRVANYHLRPVLGGRYARAMTALEELGAVPRSWPEAEAAENLEALGVAVVVEHPPVRSGTPTGWRCVTLDEHRLCFMEAPPSEPWTPPVSPAGVAGPWWPPFPERTRRVADFPDWSHTAAGPGPTPARPRTSPTSPPPSGRYPAPPP